MSSKTVEWRNLPRDMLIMIAKLLDTRSDILRLRAVCSPWRSSLPLPDPLNNSPLFTIKFPLPTVPNPNSDLNPNPNPGDFYTITQCTIYYIEPSHHDDSANPKGWMVKVEEAKLGKMRILDTLSHRQLSEWFKVRPKVLNLLNFRVFEVTNVYHLHTGYKKLTSSFVRKVVISSIPLWTHDINADCTILAIHTNRKLGYFKLGDDIWTMIDGGEGESPHYDDILYRKDQFYAVDCKGKMLVFDSSLNVTAIESPVLREEYQDNVFIYKSLVESNGDLYLVGKYSDWYIPYDDDAYDYVIPDELIRFKVYKFNDEERGWVQVTSLGDQAFFIGSDCCFAVTARQFSGCKSNCIYFTDRSFLKDKDTDDERPGNDVGIFDLEDDNSEPLSYFYGYSRIFWPPPKWLKPNVSLKPSSSRR